MSLAPIATAVVKPVNSDEPVDAHAQFVGALFEGERTALLGYLSGLLRDRVEAEDVLQETYVRLLESRTLDRASYARARSYAFKTATNLAYDRFRKRKTAPALHVAAPEPGVGSAHDDPGLQILSLEQSIAALRQALLTLEPRCRRVFLSRVAEDMSYETIAAQLGVSKRTVEREMRRALDVCQDALRDD